MSGVRRVETPARAQTPIVSWDLGRGLVKVNPIATWTDADVDGYIRDRDLPVHPLAERGYAVDRLLALHPPRRPTARTPATAAGPAPTRSSAACTSSTVDSPAAASHSARARLADVGRTVRTH